MSGSGLGEDSLPVFFFRVSCDLGFAVEKCRDLLAFVRHDLGDLSLFQFLVAKSRTWLDSHVDDLADQTYEGHVELLRSKIKSDILSNSSTNITTLYSKILDNIKPVTVEVLSQMLGAILDDAFSHVGDTIIQYGGKSAKDRWERCKRAILVFESEEAGPTRCTFHRGRGSEPDRITLRIGSQLGSAFHPQKGALRTYFLLDFNFCHEYLSHSFCVWDDKRHLMTEGLMVWVAHHMVALTAIDNVRRQFVIETLDNRPKPVAPQAAERAAEWFHAIVGPSFVSYLLEWAAAAKHPDNDERIQRICYLADVASAGKSNIINDIRRAFPGDPETVNESLLMIARATLPSQPYQPIL